VLDQNQRSRYKSSVLTSGFHSINRGYGYDGKHQIYFIDNDCGLYKFNVQSIFSAEVKKNQFFDGEKLEDNVEDIFVDRNNKKVYCIRLNGEIGVAGEENCTKF